MSKPTTCSILLLNDRNEVLLILRDDTPEIPHRNMWDLPGGHAEANESAEQCIVREIKEEMGVQLSELSLFSVQAFGERVEHTFWKRVDLDIDRLVLTEGQRLAWFSEREIRGMQLAFGFHMVVAKFFRKRPYEPQWEGKEMRETEYAQCFGNYAYRDQLVAQQFYWAITLAVLTVGILEGLPTPIGRCGVLVAWLLVLCAFCILLLELIFNTSAKRAAAARALEIERKVADACAEEEDPPVLAERIGESALGLTDTLIRIRHTSTQMVWLVIVLLAAWLVYGGATILR